jgi:hypothetical protein
MAMKKFLMCVCGILCGLPFMGVSGETPRAALFPESDYLILTLSENQLDEVESRRRVTLSKAQLEEARALASSFPKRVGVASPFVNQIPNSRFSPWPDQITGIWFCKNKVAIPRETMDGVEGCREFHTTLFDGDAVLVGIEGDFWIGCRSVDREKLIKSLDVLAIKEPEGAAFKIFVLRPPVLDDAQEEQVVQRAVEDVANLCQARDLGCHIGG